MGQSSSTPPTEPDVKTPVTEEKKKPGPCCACPETKKVRDECIAERGAENCTKFIEAHRECMKKMGYNI